MNCLQISSLTDLNAQSVFFDACSAYVVRVSSFNIPTSYSFRILDISNDRKCIGSKWEMLYFSFILCNKIIKEELHAESTGCTSISSSFPKACAVTVTKFPSGLLLILLVRERDLGHRNMGMINYRDEPGSDAKASQ